MARYASISDHGLIGDLQTAALVTTDGTWTGSAVRGSTPPSVFASLVDADKGGHFRIAPDRDDFVSRQLYLPGTAILITRFMTPDGVGEVRDFMPVITGKAAERHRLVRVLTVPRGTMRFAMDLQPRFDYGRQAHTLTISDRGAMFEEEGSGGMRLTLHTVGRGGAGNGDGEGVQVRNQGDGLQATWTLGQGEATGVVLESMGGQPRRLDYAQYLTRTRDAEGAAAAIKEARAIAGRLRCQPLLDRAADIAPAKSAVQDQVAAVPDLEEPTGPAGVTLAAAP
jgi:GH15 family glucan-1,4-alpha-glucosidase